MADQVENLVKKLLYLIVPIFLVFSDLVIAENDELYRCPPGLPRNRYLKTHLGKCYQFVNDEMYWTDASSYCRYRTGNLITIRRRDIQTFVEESLLDLHCDRNGMWIGAHDRGSEGDWYWVTGESIHGSYQNWASGQPSCWWPLKSLCMEDCACMQLKGGYRWHDYFCAASEYKYIFACEYDMLPKTTIPTIPTTPIPSRMLQNPTSTTTSQIPKSTTKIKTATRPTYSIKISKEEGVNVGELPAADQKAEEKPVTYSTSDDGGWSRTVVIPEVLGTPDSERLVSDNGGLQTGSIVGMVVSFVLVFIAGMIIGVIFCKRRERKRYLAANDVSQSFNNVIYSTAPTGHAIKPKDNNVLYVMSESDDESLYEDDDHRYADIDDLRQTCHDEGATCSPKAVECTADVVDVPKETDAAVYEEIPYPPACPGRSDTNLNVPETRFAVEFLEKDTDVFQAYSNNLYDVIKS